jgi:uncharacterized membrane protein required for colicin V production
MEGLLIFTALSAIFIHLLSFGTGLFVFKKYENQLQTLSYKCMFNIKNFNSHRLWMVLFSSVTSFTLFILGIGEFAEQIRQNNLPELQGNILGILVGIVMIQYHLYLLFDKRR